MTARSAMRLGWAAAGTTAVAVLIVTLAAGCPFFPPPIQEIVEEQIKDGSALYSSQFCGGCHGNDACGSTGPNIRNATFDSLVAVLRDPAEAHLGGTFDLSDDEIQAIATFLASLADQPCPEIELEPAEPAARVVDFDLIAVHDPDSPDYREDCTTCHGSRTREGAPLGDIPAAHAMMQKILGTGSARCRSCHNQGVDLLFHSTQRLRGYLFDSPVVNCASSACHGASGPLPFYMVDQD